MVPEQAINKFLKLKAEAQARNEHANTLSARWRAEHMRAVALRQRVPPEPVESHVARDGRRVAPAQLLDARKAALLEAEAAERSADHYAELARNATEHWQELGSLVHACEAALRERGVPETTLRMEDFEFRGIGALIT